MTTRISRQTIKWIVVCALLLLALLAAWGFRGAWLPALRPWLPAQGTAEATDATSEDAGHDAHEDEHGHDGHDEMTSLYLSEQALRNIGLTGEKLAPIELGSFTRTLTVPARVVERPGRTRVQVGAPMTGVVTAVHALQGEAVEPGTLLFKVRLTHEDLVQAQTTFLQTLGELDVEQREIERLKVLDKKGIIAGKTLLEREYASQKLEAGLGAHREALLLHGLSSKQIDAVVRDRKLLRELEVRAPETRPEAPTADRRSLAIQQTSVVEPSAGNDAASRPFMVQQVNVETGEMVTAGDSLCVLADLRELYVEGRAFEQDADEITHAARMQAADESGWGVEAVLENNGRSSDGGVENLKIVYVDNEVDAESRALHFYVALDNEVLHQTRTADGHLFLTWRFKPGQRMQLQVPIEQWQKQIVLPVEAVVDEGAEQYVFQQNGDHFDRVPVHVEYRDQFSAVIANDGSLFPGDVVARTGAHQMQVALKNKAGGAVDPHAGHNH